MDINIRPARPFNDSSRKRNAEATRANMSNTAVFKVDGCYLTRKQLCERSNISKSEVQRRVVRLRRAGKREFTLQDFQK